MSDRHAVYIEGCSGVCVLCSSDVTLAQYAAAAAAVAAVAKENVDEEHQLKLMYCFSARWYSAYSRPTDQSAHERGFPVAAMAWRTFDH